MPDKKYPEILQDPAIDTDTRRALEEVDPVVRNRFARVLEALEQKQRVEGMRKHMPWIGSFMEYLNEAFVQTQKQLANPETRPERVSPEFLGGQMKGLLIAIEKVKQDVELLNKIDIADAQGLDLGKKP